eukprot:TRINITY_DN13321_c0_g1_i1.p1 TRINITY_DN13321_c0_g1~~TRINITY_DN13321_c0_g1_i1.p1  ORF type:complete len:842 (+),score=185.54 TRINITY_DN13321_c0_g1_i1:144-2669(+)
MQSQLNGGAPAFVPARAPAPAPATDARRGWGVALEEQKQPAATAGSGPRQSWGQTGSVPQVPPAVQLSGGMPPMPGPSGVPAWMPPQYVPQPGRTPGADGFPQYPSADPRYPGGHVNYRLPTHPGRFPPGMPTPPMPQYYPQQALGTGYPTVAQSDMPHQTPMRMAAPPSLEAMPQGTQVPSVPATAPCPAAAPLGAPAASVGSADGPANEVKPKKGSYIPAKLKGQKKAAEAAAAQVKAAPEAPRSPPRQPAQPGPAAPTHAGVSAGYRPPSQRNAAPEAQQEPPPEQSPPPAPAKQSPRRRPPTTTPAAAVQNGSSSPAKAEPVVEVDPDAETESVARSSGRPDCEQVTLKLSRPDEPLVAVQWSREPPLKLLRFGQWTCLEKYVGRECVAATAKGQTVQVHSKEDIAEVVRGAKVIIFQFKMGSTRAAPEVPAGVPTVRINTTPRELKVKLATKSGKVGDLLDDICTVCCAGAPQRLMELVRDLFARAKDEKNVTAFAAEKELLRTLFRSFDWDAAPQAFALDDACTVIAAQLFALGLDEERSRERLKEALGITLSDEEYAAKVREREEKKRQREEARERQRQADLERIAELQRRREEQAAEAARRAREGGEDPGAPARPAPPPASPPRAAAPSGPVYPLARAWRFWHNSAPLPGAKAADYRKGLNPVPIDISELGTFWAVVNSMPTAASLRVGDSLSFFRRAEEGAEAPFVRPLWEDAANKCGGVWRARLRDDHEDRIVEQMWIRLACMAAGEQLPSRTSVCGVAVERRKPSDRLCIWMNTTEEALAMPVGEALRQAISGFRAVTNTGKEWPIEFISNTDAGGAAQPMDKQRRYTID